MYYINIKNTAPGYDHTVETVDEFDSRIAASRACNEYRAAYGESIKVWISSRSTMEWRRASERKKKTPVWKSIIDEAPKDDGSLVLVETNNNCYYLGHWVYDPNKGEEYLQSDCRLYRKHIKRWCLLMELIRKSEEKS